MTVAEDVEWMKDLIRQGSWPAYDEMAIRHDAFARLQRIATASGQEGLFEKDQYGREAQLREQVAKLERKVADLEAENVRLLNDPGHDTIGKFHRGPAEEAARLAALRELPKTGTKRATVLDLLRRMYPVPLADEQIRDRLRAMTGHGWDIRSVNARRKELEEGGWVVKSDQKWHAPSGNDVSTWTLSPTAVEVLLG